MKEPGTKVEQAATQLACEWPHWQRLRWASRTTRESLKEKLTCFDAEGGSIVVSGALARNEFPPGSDIDWTLLVDGSADPRHPDLVREMGDAVATRTRLLTVIRKRRDLSICPRPRMPGVKSSLGQRIEGIMPAAGAATDRAPG